MYQVVGIERRAARDGRVYVTAHVIDHGEDLNEGGHRVQVMSADVAAIPSLVQALKSGNLVVLDERKVRFGDVEKSIVRRAIEVKGV